MSVKEIKKSEDHYQESQEELKTKENKETDCIS